MDFQSFHAWLFYLVTCEAIRESSVSQNDASITLRFLLSVLAEVLWAYRYIQDITLSAYFNLVPLKFVNLKLDIKEKNKTLCYSIKNNIVRESSYTRFSEQMGQ